MSLRVLDLFSGIGGFSLGLERAGMKTVAFCEIDPFCRKVLAKHWPKIPCYEDVRTLTVERLKTDGISVDVICGGFPCQDISVAGKGAGLAGERSGLWSEIARLVGELRPRFLIVENVAVLLGRGLDRVLGDLAALVYDAEWHCIPASAIGAAHGRDRLWIVANAECARVHEYGIDASFGEKNGELRRVFGNGLPRRNNKTSKTLANTDLPRREEQRTAFPTRAQLASAECRSWWSTEPNVGRVANGISRRVDRLRGLGNAVVPQIPELIGRAILAAEAGAA